MEQFKALTTKNWILYKRSIVGSIAEILIPVLIMMLLMIVRYLVSIEQYDESPLLGDERFTYQLYGNPLAFLFLQQHPPFFKNCSNKIIALTPPDDPIVNYLKLILGFSYNVSTYPNDDQINAIIRDERYGKDEDYPLFCFAVSFQSEENKYNYSLRFNMTEKQIPRSNRDLTLDEAVDIQSYTKSYIEGSMGITTMINNLIMFKQTRSPLNVLVNKMAPIYQENYLADGMYFYLSGTIDFICLLPLLIIYVKQTSTMLKQKEKKIRESMSIMGMSISLYYFTWFIRYFSVYLIVSLINSGIICSQLPHVPYYIPLVIFVLFSILLIIQSFFVQVFVTKSKIGIIFSILFFVFQFVLSFIANKTSNILPQDIGLTPSVQSTSSNPSLQINTAVSIVAHAAFAFALKTMLYADSNKIDLTFAESLNYYHVSITVISIAINIFFWGILTAYLQQVLPNEFGAKKHPCFCFMCKKKSNKISDLQNSSEEILQENQLQSQASNQNRIRMHIQQMPDTQKKDEEPQIESVQGKYREMEENNNCMKIIGLNKKFDEFHAVKDLSMNLYRDQIFVLLGHNGAGKTTTISMLTGMLKPTSGVIDVCGEIEIGNIRKMIGICPQHDTLYDKLTVEEHIRLFGTFKGLEGQKLEREIEVLIRDVNLEQKRHEYTKNLSGGQKRRLSVALAFAGDSKVIILDEPTSGMDTSARRYIWEMLKKYKNDRIILLTTQFMDEADYLGDRIAIMAGGKLIALGSNIYLKNKYGVGYNLTFVKKALHYESQPIIELILNHVPTSTVLSDVSAELGVQLPMDQIKNFPDLFNEIDENKDRLGIESYGISITTLEEVFLKIGKAENQQDTKIKQDAYPEPMKIQQSRMTTHQSEDDEIFEREDGCCERFCSHLWATILKRLRVIKRDKKSLMFQLLLPMIIIFLALQLMIVSFISDFPNQELTFRTYLNETNPVFLPIASSNETLLGNLGTKISDQYGDKIKLDKQILGSDVAFDEQFLFPKKKQLQTLKGGIFFENQRNIRNINETIFDDFGKNLSENWLGHLHGNISQIIFNFLPFTSIVNTKSPTSIITVQTLAAEAIINQETNKNISIVVMNQPFPRTYEELKSNSTISGFFSALILSIAMAFKFASVVAFIVKERVEKGKHQQIVCGMNLGSYWMGNMIYDYFLYCIVAGFVIGMCVALDIKSLVEGDALLSTTLLFFLLGFSNIPFTYVISNFFTSYGTAQGIVYFFNFIWGGVFPIIILILRWLDFNGSAVIGEGVSWLLRVIPAYAFGEGMINLGSVEILNSTSSEDYEIFDMSLSLAPILFLAWTSIFYIVILFIIENLQSNETFMRCFTSETKIDQTEQITDDDVLNEQKKALEADPEEYQILIKNLRKVYMVDNKKQYKVAVDNLSFFIPKGQVFGLLGVNGAGKTTTFKMLAGQIISTFGDIYFSGLKISENLSEVRKNIGYCPQFDALVDNLTVKELLELYYDLKCLPKSRKEKIICKKIKEMDLEEYSDKLSGTLSGGNKRKLSVAIAMIGNPTLIFLDEPSTGMDPKARRFMWKVISRISAQKKQSTIILITHSMEQVQALSTKMGIMVNGSFKCIGTPQHIKSKFGKGYEVEVKVNNVQQNNIEEEIKKMNLEGQKLSSKIQLTQVLEKLNASQKTRKQISKGGSGSYLWQDLQKDHQTSIQSVVQFHLIEKRIQKVQKQLSKLFEELQVIQNFQTFIRFKIGPSVSAGKLFQILQKSKEQLDIIQYSIKQASVEQIFNRFASENEKNISHDNQQQINQVHGGDKH